MIPYKDLITWFQKMLADKWGYIPNTAGTMWTQEKQDKTTNDMAKRYGQRWVGHMVADCSGTFVYVYKKYGLSIYHGSNRIARKYVVELLPISEAKPGMAAFKFHKPGEKGYQLPENYKPGGSQYNGDLNDYYHIGLVDEDPRYILNSATTVNGFIRSKISNGWNACGYLKAVDYADGGKDDDEPVVENDIMIVTSENGAPVNMRESASVNSRIVARVPVGSEVIVMKVDKNGWTGVKYGRHDGYMMTKFLKPKEDDVTPIDPDDNGNDDDGSYKTEAETYRLALVKTRDTIQEEIERLNKLVSNINEVLDRFKDK